MGGINPPCSCNPTMEAMQKVTLALCGINQYFWEGHAEIERAVLIETTSSERAEQHIDNARMSFELAWQFATAAQKACMGAGACFDDHGEAQTKAALYVKRQLPRVVALGGGLQALVSKMDPIRLRENQIGSIQGGMLFDREHSWVRHCSLSILSTLSAVNADHGVLVTHTNGAVVIPA